LIAESEVLISFCFTVKSVSGSWTKYLTGVGVAGIGVDVLGRFVGVTSGFCAVGKSPGMQAAKNIKKITTHNNARLLIKVLI
jgi:hypothetical protein